MNPHGFGLYSQLGTGMNKNSDPGHSIEIPPLRLDLKTGRLWKGERPV